MKRTWKIFLSLLLAAGCSTVPITGRKQLALVPDSQLLPLSFSSYKEVISQSKLSNNQEQTELVKKVGKRIQVAVESFMNQHNMTGELEGYAWEFNLIEDKTVNAWCMPGGKVAFYSGIMPICQDEAGVAVVMGHEVAHAIANHGGERMSQGLIQQLGGVALAVAIRNEPEETQMLYYSAYAIGSTYGAMLPFSRLHESEADKLGLVFMAMAGYDPHEAPKFWQRMDQFAGQSQPPQWMSTHPSHDSRIETLNAYMPAAMSYYKKEQKKDDIPFKVISR